jgi:microcystin-dependent protein
MAVTETTKLKLQKQDAGDAGWHAALNLTLDRIEEKLAKSCAGDPNPTKAGESAGDYVGQFIYDTTNEIYWFCTTAGAAGTAIWERALTDLSGAASPQGAVAGAYVGQRYFDTTNIGWWTCTTVGDAGTAVWTPDIAPKTIRFLYDTAVPAGWLTCDGTAGTPNMIGKFPVGYDGGAADPDYDTIGETGGEKTHVLTAAELAAHSHTPRVKSFLGQGTVGIIGCSQASDTDATDGETDADGGSGDAHENRPPYIVGQWIIKKPVV